MEKTFQAALYYMDSECGGQVQSVEFEEQDILCDHDYYGGTKCYMTDDYEWMKYTEKDNCTTDPAQQLELAFGDQPFLMVETVSGVSVCTDVPSNETMLKALLGNGVYDTRQDASLTIDDEGFAFFTVDVNYITNTSMLLSPTFLAEPNCIIFDNSSYSFANSALATASGSNTASGSDYISYPSSWSDTGLVYYAYGDSDCSGTPGSVFIIGHGYCFDNYGESGIGCTRTYIGNDEFFFRVSCMNERDSQRGRQAVLDEAFGDEVYLAFDFYPSAATGDDDTYSYSYCSEYELAYTYAYVADGWYHYGFDYEEVRVILNDDGSGSMKRGKCVRGTSCDTEIGQIDFDYYDVKYGDCKSDGIDKYEFYSNADVFQDRDDYPDSRIIAGSVGFILIVMAVQMCRWRRRSQAQLKKSTLAVSLMEEGVELQSETPPTATPATKSVSTSQTTPNVPVAATSARAYDIAEAQPGSTSPLWDDPVIISSRLPREKIVFANILSRGGYGEVYVGTFNTQPVAIKMLLPEKRRDITHINAFLAEAKLLATLDHPYIVQFIGVAWDSLFDLCVLSEFMTGGDLRSMLSNFQATGHPTGFDDDKIRIAYNIAQALTYLHSLSSPIIHRDLKSRNVLLMDETLDAKLTDFGVSRERAINTMTAGVGTFLWMAPEVMMGERYNERADMFSLGVLLSELDTHALPYSNSGLPHTHIVQLVASGMLRVMFSVRSADVYTARVVELANACVSVDPSNRPTAAEATYALHSILRDMA